MRVNSEADIPKPKLRPLFRLWARHCAGDRLPSRADIRLEELRSAAAHTLFCTVEEPYRGLESIRFTNTGTGFVDAIGVDLTGRTAADTLRDLGATEAFTHCFTEYGKCLTERRCFYNEGVFPALAKDWLTYQRLVMPLGEGDRATGIFVVCDFDDAEVGLRLPAHLDPAMESIANG